MKSANNRQEKKSFDQEIKKRISLDYLLYLPTNYDKNDKFPLVIFLHGSGERGSNIEKIKAHGIPKLIEEGKEFEFIAVSPQCPANDVWNVDSLNALVDNILINYKIDRNRIYLTGISMGGGGVWNFAVEHPEKFAAIAPICGVINRNLPLRADKLKDLPVWVFHGEKDNVVSVSHSEMMVNAIKEKGNNKVKFTVYPDLNHDSWTITYENPDFFNWLLKQKKK